ncbi:hypothetical protein [Sorangium sp. So ce1000]|uniref:hypothetical protein n=1 Tax=Sorangium sp. So ce1000 TaxID=3133325 RepID=UPI003F617DF0
MAGVINAATEATYTDLSGVTWTYFQDNDNASIFYVMPVPAFLVQDGVPQFHLTEYLDDHGNFLSAQCRLTTILAVPPVVIQAVQDALEHNGVSSPTYQAMSFVDIGRGGAADPNQAFLNIADAAGTVSRTVQAVPSLSGSQIAIFNLTELREGEVRFVKAYFGGRPGVGSVQVVYRLTFIARLGEVTARVQFDAQAAYNYQRTFKWVT